MQEHCAVLCTVCNVLRTVYRAEYYVLCILCTKYCVMKTSQPQGAMTKTSTIGVGKRHRALIGLRRGRHVLQHVLILVSRAAGKAAPQTHLCKAEKRERKFRRTKSTTQTHLWRRKNRDRKFRRTLHYTAESQQPRHTWVNKDRKFRRRRVHSAQSTPQTCVRRKNRDKKFGRRLQYTTDSQKDIHSTQLAGHQRVDVQKVEKE
jgi:hypothetical protein